MQRTVRKTTYVYLVATGLCFLLVTLWRPDSHMLMAADAGEFDRATGGFDHSATGSV